MFFRKFISDKKLYLAIDAIICLIGYIFILKGFSSGDNDTFLSKPVLLSIGTSLIATSIVAFLDIWKECHKDSIFEKIHNVISDGGISKLYNKRDLDRYDSLMGNLKNNLDITGYSLVAFYDSYADLLQTKLQTNSDLKIRVVFVDPDSEFSKHRSNIEGTSPIVYKENINRFIKKFDSFDNVKIKLVSTPLSTMIFRIDDIMYVGPHFFKRSSKSTLTIELNQKGWMFDEYSKEFDRLWEG